MDGPLTHTHGKTAKGEAGFSLLETLFALAIMSIASLALFQSTSAMLQVSDRAVRTGERTLNSELDRIVTSNIVEGIMTPWPEHTDSAFTGSAREFSGLSTGTPQAGAARPARFTLTLERQNSGSVLIYRAVNEVRIARAPRAGSVEPAAAESWVLMHSLPEAARFEYMGIDQKFYNIWPPLETPSRGYFNDDILMKGEALPEAIRLITAQEQTLWTAPLDQAARLPPRTDINVRP